MGLAVAVVVEGTELVMFKTMFGASETEARSWASSCVGEPLVVTRRGPAERSPELVRKETGKPIELLFPCKTFVVVGVERRPSVPVVSSDKLPEFKADVCSPSCKAELFCWLMLFAKDSISDSDK